MSIEVEGPDGSVVEFPDGTSHDVIKGAMAKHFGSPTKSQATEAEAPKDTSFSKGLAYGAENAIRGLSATSKFLGAPKRSMADQLADAIHSGAGLDNYAPAGAVVGDSSKGVGERLMSAPRALVEGAPGLGTDLVAGAVAGPLGFLTSNAARNLGQNVEASKGDLPKALGVTAADAILSRMGARATVGSAAKSLTKAVGTDAAVNVSQGILDKDILRGESSTPSDAVVNAVTGAAAGVAGKGLDTVANMPKTPGAFKDRRFNPVTDKLDQNSLARVATKLDEARQRGSKDDYNHAYTETNNDILMSVKDPFFKAQLRENPKVAHTVDAVLKNYGGRLKDGQVLTDEDIGRLSDVIGHTDEGQAVIKALKDRNTLNQLTPLYDGGLSQSALAQKLDPNTPGFNPIRSVDFHTLWRALRGQGIGLPEVAVGAAQLAAKPLTKAVDRLTGAADPSKVLIDRFAGTEAPQAPQPSYSVTMQENLAAQAQAKLDAAQAKADAKAAAAAEKFQKKADAQKVAQTQKNTNAILERLDKLEEQTAQQQQKDELQGAKDKRKADATQLKNIQAMVGNLKINYMPQSERLGRDMPEPASLPENPGYGTASPVDPKDLAFNALLAQKLGIKDLNRITHFRNGEEIDPSQVPMDDPHRETVIRQLEVQAEAKREADYVRRELETEKAMKALGIDTSRMPLPDAWPNPHAPSYYEHPPVEPMARREPSPYLRVIDTFAPQERQTVAPDVTTATARSENLTRIDEILSGRSGKPKAKKAPIEEAMAPPKEAPKASPMESVIREVNPDLFKVKTKEGDVIHATKDTHTSEEGRAKATRLYADSRAQIWRATPKRLSPNARNTFNRNMKGWMEDIRALNNEEAARSYVDENVLPKFAKQDQEKLLAHFDTYKPSVTIGGEKVSGRTFFKTWVHKTAEKASEARTRNQKMAAERMKREAAQEEDE